jgi:hypothetical protein
MVRIREILYNFLLNNAEQTMRERTHKDMKGPGKDRDLGPLWLSL